jgi:hypothetical protein
MVFSSPDSASLDQIVDAAWTKMQQELQPGEPVELRVKASPSAASANPEAKAYVENSFSCYQDIDNHI